MTEIDDKRVEAAARALCSRDDSMYHHERTDDHPCSACLATARAALEAADAEVVDRLARARAWIVTCVDPAQVGVETKQAMLDYLDGKRDLPADVSAVTITPETGRCGDRVPVMPLFTRPVFCELPHGHDGWHKAGNVEWTPGEVSVNLYTTPETVDEDERDLRVGPLPEIDRDELIAAIRPEAIGGAGYLQGNPETDVLFGIDGSIDVGDIADAVIAFIREVGQ